MRTLIVYLLASILLFSFIPGCSKGCPVVSGIERAEVSGLTIANDMDRRESASGFLGLCHIDIGTSDFTRSVEPF